MNWNRIRFLLIKELTQLRRDRRLFGMLVFAPVVQLLVLGFAITTDIREIKVGVRDLDRTSDSREYVRAMGASGYFRVSLLEAAGAGDADLLVSGRAGLLVIIPPGFGQRLRAQEPSRVQVLADGSDSNLGVQGLNYLEKATRQFNRGLAPAGRRGASLNIESRVWYTPDMVSRIYMVPAMMALLLIVVTMVVTSMALVKEREEGTMEQVIVTPLRPSEIVLGKLLPFAAIGLVELTLSLLVVRFVFEVPCRGSLALFYGVSGLFLFTTLGLGLLVSLLVKTQQQAMMFASFFLMMPFVLLSGFIFPIENMPPAIQRVTAIIPLKYYITALRGIFLKGSGLHELWPQMAALAAFGAVILPAAILRFHKRLD
jgi:ABC-2 type transport system permease protein